MARGKTGLDSREYDDWLSINKKENELRKRNAERRDANKGVVGWHFGIDEKPVYAKDKEQYKHELRKRGLMLRDDVKRNLK